MRGDRSQNLEDLKNGDSPTEPVSKQLWVLLHQGYNRHQLEAALELMADCSWTSMVVEQQHGSMASIHRHHPEYGAQTLVTRALVLQCRRLLPAATKEEKQLLRMSAQLEKVLRRNPDKNTGRQALVSALFEHLRERFGGHSTREVPKDIAARIFRGHSRIWAAASAADQLAYEYLANTRASEQWHKHEVEAGEIRKRIQDLLTSLEEQGQERKPLVLSQNANSETENMKPLGTASLRRSIPSQMSRLCKLR